jgi:5-formyltetrahydrofolate cyclo-ligase
VRATRALEVCAYPCALETLSFGLRQPSASVPALTQRQVAARVDAAVIPGLAFDLHARRLGHGAGYFDRFLACHSQLLALGLTHDLQVVDHLPVEAHDIAMTSVITATRVIQGVAG